MKSGDITNKQIFEDSKVINDRKNVLVKIEKVNVSLKL